MALAVKALHNYSSGHDKFYVCRIDYIAGSEKPYRVVASWGPTRRPKAQAEQAKGEYSLFENARATQGQLLRKKVREGYVDVESSLYGRGSLGDSKGFFLTKVDMTRCCNDDGSWREVPPQTFRSLAPTPLPSPPTPPAVPHRRKITRLKKGK